MKIAPRDAPAFLAKPPAAMRAILFYGENPGLARDFADAVTRKIVPDAKDSERCVELSAADLRKDPARLSDEASQMSMFSPGRRVIRIRDASEGMGEIFASFLKESAGDAMVLVEAQELSAKASLRQAFESAANAAAVACYEDTLETLVRLAADELKPLGIGVEDGALEALVARTGADRRILRGELQKIALYFAGVETAQKLTVALVGELSGQAGDVEASEIASAVANGDGRRLDRLLVQAEDAGGSPSFLVTASLRHLHALMAALAHGPHGEAVDVARARGLWGQSETAIRSELRRWTLDRLAAAVRILGQAEADTRSGVWPDWPVAARALLHAARLAG
jgi:DNA polymerase III subunit delta